MKKTLLASGVALAVSMASIASYADDNGFAAYENTAEIKTLKGGMTFGAASIVGGLLAGPIGFMIGGASGTLLGSELDKADKYDTAMLDVEKGNADLVELQAKVSMLQDQLHTSRQQQQQLNDVAMTNLEFQLLFHTGDDGLNPQTEKRLDELAEFLKRNSELSVRLHGYADPRGTDEYNNVLSMYRAINVQHALEKRGVDTSRIERRYYGADQSQSTKGDLDAYALDRKVTVEVYDQKNGVAVVDEL